MTGLVRSGLVAGLAIATAIVAVATFCLYLRLRRRRMAVEDQEASTHDRSSSKPAIGATSSHDELAEVFAGVDSHAGVAEADNARELRRQLGLLDDGIQSYDLHDDHGARRDDAPSRARSLHLAERAAAGHGQESAYEKSANGLNQASSRHGLASLSNQDARLVVQELKVEKRQLQKLIIAQKASLEAEREQHEKTRELAIEVIDRLKRSRLDQQRAVKIARRERAQRMKLESKLDTFNQRLLNAQSILSERAVQLEESEA